MVRPHGSQLSSTERARIRALLEEVVVDLESKEALLVESADPANLDSPVGRLSRMDGVQSYEMAKAGLSRLRQRLASVRHALRRVDEPEFGLCDSCGGSIGLDRLEFQPEATRCVRCA